MTNQEVFNRIREALDLPIAEVERRLDEFERDDVLFHRLREYEGDSRRLLLAVLEHRGMLLRSEFIRALEQVVNPFIIPPSRPPAAPPPRMGVKYE